MPKIFDHEKGSLEYPTARVVVKRVEGRAKAA